MDNVIEFPSRDMRYWNELKDAMQEFFDKHGDPQECSSFVIQTMRKIFDKYQTSVDVMVDSPEQMPMVLGALQPLREINSNLFGELTLAYRQIWYLSGSK